MATVKTIGSTTTNNDQRYNNTAQIVNWNYPSVLYDWNIMLVNKHDVVFSACLLHL